MADLACDADILTPNLTEAAIILGEEWHGTNISDDEAKRIIDALIAKGAKNVVLKGIQRDDGVIRNFAAGVNIDFFEASNEYLPICFTARAICIAPASWRLLWLDVLFRKQLNSLVISPTTP